MIYYDPTEARDTSLLPQEIQVAGKPLQGLETLTGADLLLTRNQLEFNNISLHAPQPIANAFTAACRNGILIQRKSGLDLLSSLNKLNNIQLKMSQFGGEYWLVATGFVAERGGVVVLDKRVTKWRYSTLMAKLATWQRRGGYLYLLPDDDYLVNFVATAEKWLTVPMEKVVAKRPLQQNLVPADWWERLTAVPGFGLSKAKALAEWLPEEYRTLAHALEYLSHFEEYERTDHPERVGPSDFKAARAWLMLSNVEYLDVREK